MEFITSDMFLTFAGCLAIVALVTQVIKSLPPLDKINTLWTTFGVSILVGVIRLFLIGDFTAQGITMGVLNILAIYLGAIGGYETVKQITKK
jgi:hypothetical protein